jgi:uncharacterized MAPEG superfamily protein
MLRSCATQIECHRLINNETSGGFMDTQLQYLTYATLLTAVIWIPYILNEIMVRGLMDALGYPASPKPLAPWATRLKAAHYNAVENLVVFATLVLVANAMHLSNHAIVMSCIVYFWARVAHLLAYAFAIPGVRTLAFVIGWLAQLCIAWHILGW